MPPKKVFDTNSNAKEAQASASTSSQTQQDILDGIENFELPKSLVTKIAKSAIPDNAKLQKEVVLSLVKGSTVFINYLAATAHDIAYSKQHKSISASDVLKALELLEFGDMVNHLQHELQAYRENQRRGRPTTVSLPSASTSSHKRRPSTSEPNIPNSNNSNNPISISIPPRSKASGSGQMMPPSVSQAVLDQPLPTNYAANGQYPEEEEEEEEEEEGDELDVGVCGEVEPEDEVDVEDEGDELELEGEEERMGIEESDVRSERRGED